MTTWGETKEVLGARFAIADDRGELLAVTVEGQRVIVALRSIARRATLHCYASVGAERTCSPREAVLHNATLAVGALALTPHGWVFETTLPLAGLEADDLDLTLQIVAGEAARLRARGGSLARRHVTDVFTTFAD